MQGIPQEQEISGISPTCDSAQKEPEDWIVAVLPSFRAGLSSVCVTPVMEWGEPVAALCLSMHLSPWLVISLPTQGTFNGEGTQVSAKMLSRRDHHRGNHRIIEWPWMKRTTMII